MVNVRIKDLSEAASPSASEFVAIDADVGGTRKTSLTALVNAGRPLADQAEAEAGVEATKAMTPLTTKQAIEAIGDGRFASAAQGALADTALQPANIGTSVQAYNALLDSVSALSLSSGDLIRATGANAVTRLPIGSEGQVLSVVGGALAYKSVPAIDLPDPAVAETVPYRKPDNSGYEAKPAGVTGLDVLAAETAEDARSVITVGTHVATRTALKALDTTKDTVAYLTEEGREGQFIWRTGDYSTEIASDPREGVYLKADAVSASSGAWVRVGGWALEGVSIEWFYEVADSGDYSSALEAACEVFNVVVCPAGNYEFRVGAQLPAKQLDIKGAGLAACRIFGDAPALITWPTSVTDGGGNVVTQNFHGFMVEPTADNIGLKVHQTWDSGGKVGPEIFDNWFYNSSPTTTTARAISLQGIWSADIYGNWFRGQGTGGGPTTGIGGYGVYFDLDADMNTSIMNVTINDNNFLTLAYPIWMETRSGDGRIEGVSILDNLMIAGNIGIRMAISLATNINGNIISDFDKAIEGNRDFGFVIVGNTELDGKTACIHLVNDGGGILERGTISGNIISCSSASDGILIENNYGDDTVRALTISGNTFGGNVAAPAAVGVKFTGSYRSYGCTIDGNTFEGLDAAIDYASATNADIKVGDNTYIYVNTKIRNPERSGYLIDKRFASSVVVSLTGGATTESVDVDISSAGFSQKPLAASLELDGSHFATVARLLKGGYDEQSVASTASNARFVVCNSDGSPVVNGARRFTVVCHGRGFVTG